MAKVLLALALMAMIGGSPLLRGPPSWAANPQYVLVYPAAKRVSGLAQANASRLLCCTPIPHYASADGELC